MNVPASIEAGTFFIALTKRGVERDRKANCYIAPRAQLGLEKRTFRSRQVPNHVPPAHLPFNMLEGLRKAGIDLAAMAERAGLAAEDLKKPLSVEQADRVFVAAYEMSQDPAAGLALGLQSLRAELFGVVGFSGMSSPDFGTALRRIARYNALVSACQIDIRAGVEECEIRIRYDGPVRP